MSESTLTAAFDTKDSNNSSLDRLSAIADIFAKGDLNGSSLSSLCNLDMSALGNGSNPLDAVMGAALDYLMDLILKGCKPLADVVDSLLGSPEEIKGVAQKWTQTANQVASSANAFVDSLPQVRAWQSNAAETYRTSVRRTHELYKAAAASAASVAQWVTAVGGLVSTVRQTLWSWLREFLMQVIQSALSALAAAVPTYGGSITSFISWFTGKLSAMCSKFASTISKLMSKVGTLVQKLGVSAKSFTKAIQLLRQVSEIMGAVKSSTGRESSGSGNFTQSRINDGRTAHSTTHNGTIRSGGGYGGTVGAGSSGVGHGSGGTTTTASGINSGYSNVQHGSTGSVSSASSAPQSGSSASTTLGHLTDGLKQTLDEVKKAGQVPDIKDLPTGY